MTTDKRDDQSHVIDCSDMMTTFLSKEGANSYPTSTVLLNRFFVSPDDYKWKENSGITIDMPKFKVGDDVHWYKLKDLYTNLKNAIISESIFKGIKIFKSETVNPPSASNKAFATKNKYYILDQNTKQIYWTDTFDKTGFTHSTNPATDPIESIIDFVSVGSIDFMLCKHAVYAFENNTYIKALDEQGANFNAFDATSNKLVIAADDGARGFAARLGRKHAAQDQGGHQNACHHQSASAQDAGLPAAGQLCFFRIFAESADDVEHHGRQRRQDTAQGEVDGFLAAVAGVIVGQDAVADTLHAVAQQVHRAKGQAGRYQEGQQPGPESLGKLFEADDRAAFDQQRAAQTDGHDHGVHLPVGIIAGGEAQSEQDQRQNGQRDDRKAAGDLPGSLLVFHRFTPSFPSAPGSDTGRGRPRTRCSRRTSE